MARETNLVDLRALKKELHEIRNLLLERAALSDRNEYLRPHTACRMFGISPTTLRNFRRYQHLPFIKISRVVYYHIDDIKRVLEASKNLNLKTT
jgi:hypothetical protein